MNQLLNEIRKKDAKAFTHGGKFHADDVFSAALLLYLNPEIQISRGNRVLENFDGLVFDIGRGAYDHHQKDSRIRENGVPYAAFGLLWEALGAEILGEELANSFDEAFVQPLDNNDNTGKKNELASLIGNFNPAWDAEGGTDKAFFQAVNMAGMILENKFERYRGNERADRRVEEILVEQEQAIKAGEIPEENRKILILPEFVPCQKRLSETEIAFVIFPSNRGGYCIQPQKREYSMNYKCCFPEEWLGLEKEELQAASGLSGAKILKMALPELPEVEMDGIFATVAMEKQDWKNRIKAQVKVILKEKPEAVYVEGDIFSTYPIIHALRRKHVPVLITAFHEEKKILIRIPSGS